MRNKIGTAAMALGAALVLAALALFFWNRQEDRAAGEAAEGVLAQVVEQIEMSEDAAGAQDKNQGRTREQQQEEPEYPGPYGTAMAEAEIGGDTYVGYLSVPALGLALPVMSGWSYEGLKVAPCRYAGSARTGDLVICAHNYIKHFGLLQNLSCGEAVYFTDMDGKVWQYEVAEVDILAPTDVEGMLSGEYGLTLFTCTYGGQSRVTVRCERVQGAGKAEEIQEE